MSQEDITERLVRIETKLDGIQKVLPDHEKRVRRLEYMVWSAAGIVPMISALFGKGHA